MWEAVFSDVGVTVLAVLNAMRKKLDNGIILAIILFLLKE
ncbi:hypothetical protein CGLO_11208 [Colletotrichum gloeosporioides Cg-14]|uniref:Uncharacterized protein n=1 Tax=Colletotrichum gloeosporioides (strain Cg-14) TaxID=1237896 RepID=T0LMJ8_COLGC|nr:hypothetical protein CGLO_11208 [Colletotrichum gloeosporioides Cg-14]